MSWIRQASFAVSMICFLSIMIIPVFAFHENIAGLDTEKEIKKYYREHISNDPAFQSNVRQQEQAALKEITSCILSSAAGKVITGSEFLESKMVECDKYMVILEAACRNHYDVYEFCSKALSRYVTDRDLDGKVIDAMVSSNFGRNIDATENSNSNTSLPAVESMNESFGGIPISSLREKFTNSD